MMPVHSAPTASTEQFWIEQRQRIHCAPGTINLNAGTLSPTPIPVLEAVTALRQQMASNPSDFVWRQTPLLLKPARQRLAEYVRCNAEDLLLLPNITFGLNIVSSSLQIPAGAEILTTDHEYGAMMMCWRRAAERQGCTIRQVTIPYLAEEPARIVDSIAQAITPGKTRVLFFSHVNCTTGLVMPARELCELARRHGLISVIDGAHAPGMIPVDLTSIGADFYAANCHKWMMAPAAAGFLRVAPGVRSLIRPQITSWGYEYDPADESKSCSGGGSNWQWSYEFHGTVDRTPQMVLPQALDFRGDLGGDDAVASRTRALVDHARTALSNCGLSRATPQNPAMSGALVAFHFPACDPVKVRDQFWQKHQIECPITIAAGKHFLRVSCAWFNTRSQLNALSDAVPQVLRWMK
jgi:isopenicillin-N epimerase